MSDSQLKRILHERLDKMEPSVTFQEVEKRARQKKRLPTYTQPILVTICMAILAIVVISTPSVGAFVTGLFEVKKYVKEDDSGKVGDMDGVHLGVSWSLNGGEYDYYADSTDYETFAELEKAAKMNLPMPQVVLDDEKSAEQGSMLQGKTLNKETGELEDTEPVYVKGIEASIGWDRDKTFHHYRYSMSTKEKAYWIDASNKMEERPKFSAVTKGIALDKSLVINGANVRIMGIEEVKNMKYVYAEKGDWKVFISFSNRDLDNPGKGITEEEAINIAESIDW